MRILTLRRHPVVPRALLGGCAAAAARRAAPAHRQAAGRAHRQGRAGGLHQERLTLTQAPSPNPNPNRSPAANPNPSPNPSPSPSQVDCIKSEDAHCGWAWGTVYSGVEESNGIDELGYLSAEGLLEEVALTLVGVGLGGGPDPRPNPIRNPNPTPNQVLSWRLMIVPVLRTTGVNTKILVALELGMPLTVT